MYLVPKTIVLYLIKCKLRINFPELKSKVALTICYIT